MIEVEIKSKVRDLKEIEDKIIKLGAKYISKSRTIDRVYGREQDLDQARMVKEGCFSARIRSEDDKVKLEFKEIRRNGVGIEIRSDLSGTKEGEYFLNSMNYIEAFCVDKIRKRYNYQSFEIALDEVALLGSFVEIEYRATDGVDTDGALAACKELLNKIDAKATIEPRKYGDLMQSILNMDKANS